MARWQTSIQGLVQEAARYFSASPQSCLRQLESLRTLDDRLLADIAVTRGEAMRGRRLPELAAIPSHCPSGEVLVRDATEADMKAVQIIYAQQVLHGLASFEEEAPSIAELLSRRESVRAADLPYLVAELDGQVVGYTYASAYRPRSGYRLTVEDSVYVAEGMQGQGIGRALLSALVGRCETGPWHQMIAVIGDSANTGSIVLHERLGFHRVGTLDSVGFKLGRFIDTVLMQRPLIATAPLGRSTR